MEIGMQRVGAVDICLETDDDGKAADLTGLIVKRCTRAHTDFPKQPSVDGKRAQPLHAAIA